MENPSNKNWKAKLNRQKVRFLNWQLPLGVINKIETEQVKVLKNIILRRSLRLQNLDLSRVKMS
jgi:hypothetical protein